MKRTPFHTEEAPAAIGSYSQAIRHGDTVYISGQIPLDPRTMEMVEGDVPAQIHRVFRNLEAICREAGSDLNGILKLSVFLTDLSHFARVNEIMAEYFDQPYPARAAIGVASLPRGAGVEMDAILGL